MTGELLRGAGYVLTSFGWLGRRGLRGWVVVPLLINVVLFALATAWLVGQTAQLADRLAEWLPDWLDWLSWLIWPLVLLMLVLTWFYAFTVVANLIAAPFNGLLAERVAMMLRATPAAARPLWREVVIALRGELAKLVYFATRALPLLLLAFVPVVNLLTPLLWFAFGAWVLAIEYLDFPLGNRGLTLAAQRRVLASRRGLALGFGGAVALLTIVPGINLLVVPLAVIGASRLAAEQLAQTTDPPS